MPNTPSSVLRLLGPLALVACQASPSPDGAAAGAAWRLVATPGDVSLRGLAAVDRSVAWVGGQGGGIWRTTDGGASWQDVAPRGAQACDFRDLEAFDAERALALSAGDVARVYRTTDGGASWQVVLADTRQGAFFDAMAFAGDVGVVAADPLNGGFCLWTSRDAGATWQPVPRDGLPAPQPGEAAFAASGSCVAATGAPGEEQFWLATGGGERARVLRTSAGGWLAVDVPLAAGAASRGGFGFAFGPAGQVVLVGGDYTAPEQAAASGARSDDGGASWQPIAGGVGGFRSAAVWLDGERVLAVGSHGTSLSGDRGRTWSVVDPQGFHALARGRDGTVWAAGSGGRVARWREADERVTRVAPLFGDHMVLPADEVVPVHGRGVPGLAVAVQPSWGGEVVAVVGADGRWTADVATPGAGGPHTLTVRCGRHQQTLVDVLLGEVWLASGQSNMEMQLGKAGWSQGVADHEREVAAADLPTLRVFTVRQRASELPTGELDGTWTVCTPATAATFSATAFFFARELVQTRRQPVGLVVSAWGGTVAEAWTSEAGLAAFPEFADPLARQRAAAGRGPEGGRAAFWREVAAAEEGVASEVVLPAPWSRSGLADFDGVATYTREIELPPALRGTDCWLELGAIDDMDTVWWNGARVGGLEVDGAWNRPRRYRVPAGATAAGRATLRVRVVDTGGEGGFTGEAGAMRLVAAADPAQVLPLAGTWQRRTGARLDQLPPWPAAAGPNRPAVLWNGMIAPLLPFPFTGAIWYQGESNRGRAAQYARLFPALITDWRRAIGRELPFYFVQIAPFGYGGDRGETAELREAQAAALQLPGTGMVVTLDCGDARDIHPVHKRPVGERLAALALARLHGVPRACEGPTLRAATRAGAQVRLEFGATDGGLVLEHGGAGFELAGADGSFVAATARLDGDAVLLGAPGIEQPARVRYAWAAVPAWSLRNGAGLPAPPFRAAIR